MFSNIYIAQINFLEISIKHKLKSLGTNKFKSVFFRNLKDLYGESSFFLNINLIGQKFKI